LGYLASPRLGGVGGAIGQGGIAGLNAYNKAEAGQTAAQQQALKNQQDQLALQQAQQKAAALQKLPSNLQTAAQFPGTAPLLKQQGVIAANKALAQQFVQANSPTGVPDPMAAQVAAAFGNSTTPIDPGAMMTALQKMKAAPGEAQKILADIAKAQAETGAATATAGYRTAQTKALNTPPAPDTASSAKPMSQAQAMTALMGEYRAATAGLNPPGSVSKLGKMFRAPERAAINDWAWKNNPALAKAAGIPEPAGMVADASGATGAPPPLPAGATSYAVSTDGKLGYYDAAGTFHPF
jgi:hypothetical protein